MKLNERQKLTMTPIIIYPFTSVGTEATDLSIHAIKYISDPFFLALCIIFVVCTCTGIVIHSCKPAFVDPIANVKMSGSPDQIDYVITGFLINGFGLILAAFAMPRFIQLEPVKAFISFSGSYLLGMFIGGWLYFLSRRTLLRLRLISPWTTIRKLHCQECRRSLHLIASSNSFENLLFNYLNSAEQVAARLGSTDFEIWQCSHCHPSANRDSVHLRGYRRSGSVICPTCHEATMSAGHVSITRKGPQEEEEETTYTCLCCSNRMRKTRTITWSEFDPV